MTSSVYPLAVDPKSGAIAANINILNSDIEIISEMVSPGGGAILRLYMSYIFDTTPATIQVFNNDVFKGNLNADNDSQLITNGYYRFDIDIEAGDNINLKSSAITSTTINFFRAHIVQLGA